VIKMPVLYVLLKVAAITAIFLCSSHLLVLFRFLARCTLMLLWSAIWGYKCMWYLFCH